MDACAAIPHALHSVASTNLYQCLGRVLGYNTTEASCRARSIAHPTSSPLRREEPPTFWFGMQSSCWYIRRTLDGGMVAAILFQTVSKGSHCSAAFEVVLGL